MDYFPKEFSGQARARVEAERIIAKRDFERSQCEKPPDQWKKDFRTWDRWMFYRYILRVFLAFAFDACKLGRQGIWAVDRIRTEAEEFLRRFTIEAYYESGRDRYGEKFEDMTSNWNGSLLSEVKLVFQRSDAWRQFEDELLAVVQEVVETSDAQPVQSVEVCAHPQEAVPTNAGIDKLPDPVGSEPENRPMPATNPTIDLLDRVLTKKQTTLEKWASVRKLGRTSVYDWKAALLAGELPKGKVSSEKCAEIEAAIEKDAKALGLPTRTSSD